MPAKRKKSGAPSPDRKARLELRFDEDLHHRVKAVADKAGISVNQLVEGITRWAVARAVPGAPTITNYNDMVDLVTVEPARQCVFFGRPGDPSKNVLGEVLFVLDFRPRAAVHSPDDYVTQAPVRETKD